MKTIITKARPILITIALIITALSAFAQPLPPEGPSGNRVPIDGYLFYLLAGMICLGIGKLRKKKKI
ncbi:MAG TPA: hypothetical protein PLK12_06495 [Prolixibacteraceae bacterium]|nr:hypothetical protein [Prolixibacteraceae bacterium]